MIIQIRQLLGKLIKDLDNEGNSSNPVNSIVLCNCFISLSAASYCCLLAGCKLHVCVAKFFKRDMTMLVSTLSTLCFSWICTNLDFCSHIKSHLRKSESAITSFLIYSMAMLMPPRSVLWTAVLSASVRFCPHYSPVFFQGDTFFQKPVTLAAILYTSLAFLKRDFLFSSLLIFIYERQRRSL